MISFDTNLVIYAGNADVPQHPKAAAFIQSLGGREDFVVCELMLAEVYLKPCSPRILRQPLSSASAAAYCETLRNNANWAVVDSAPVMPEVWQRATAEDFAFRRIIDVRLALTLRHHGVTEFATSNTRDFDGLGFARVWNPLQAA